MDGARLGILKYGDSATVPISAGHHELRVHNTLSRKKMEFDAEPRQHVRFKSANVAGKGFAYWAFFLGAALFWTVLERENDNPAEAAPVPQPFRY